MKIRIIGVLFVLVLIVAAVLCLLALNKNGNVNKDLLVISGTSNTDKSIKDVDVDVLSSETNSYKESDFDFSTETVITIADNDSKVEGSNVKIDGNTIYITAAGAYRITGSLSDGRIIVNAPKENVKIILDNADINCSYSSAIYVYKSSATMIYVKEGTTNSLIDGSTYNYNDEFSSEEDEEPNSALYSKSNLIICGKGTLNVKGNFNNGITSKDTLYIKDVTLNVDAKNHGINGKDNATYENATISVNSGGDGLRSTNDKDASLGWIRFIDSTIKIVSQEDAIQAETDLIISGGTFDITAGDGASSSNKVDNSIPGREMWGRGLKTSSDETSRKGLKTGRYLLIDNNPTINIDSVDDAIHSSGSIQIDNGTIKIKTSDDGVHADDTLTINDGTITISESYEGLEGNDVVINDGIIDVTASDDGINVNGGNDGSGFGGFGGNINVQDKNEKTSESKTINADNIGLITTASDREDKGFSKREIPSGDFSGKPNGMKRPSSSGDTNTPPEMPSFDGGNMPERPNDGDENASQIPGNSNESNTASYKLIINGGTISINSTGDGLDSNGSIEMNDGYVIVQGPTSSMNGAIDYENSFTLNGGTILAIGASGMVQGVKSENQASIMVTTSESNNANTKIEVKDESGKTLIETTSLKSFNNIVFSCKDLEVDKTYSVYLNGALSTTTTATLNSASSRFGGFGGFGGMRGR
ncbi:MAG: carbohydrate-binding domain-containing protein [Clostridia bacterium]|nr:carbohydrate-binding domain-containing protein [Clostridia bacterium]